MIGQLTAAGVAALQGSQLVNIPLAKIGDGYNYIPAPTDTDIHGNEVWRTQPSEPMAATPNIVRWSVFMDINVGPFEFGEVGLFLPNGDLFALFAADQLIEKINVGGANLGNEVNLLIFVSMVGDNYVIWLDLASTNNQLQVARVNSPDQLPQPRDAYPNIYIMPGADDNQQSILAVTDRQGLWAFGGYDLADTLRATVSAFDSNSVTVSASEFNQNMIPEYFGQLILQFNTGPLYGICRYVKTTNQDGANWRLSFNTPLVITPNVGDTFFIQKRNPLTLETGNLPVATRTSVGVVRPLQSLTLTSGGDIGVDWTKLTLNGTPATQSGDGGSFTLTISKVGETGIYGDLLNIPPAFMPFLASATQRGGMKIDPNNSALYLDANEVLQINTAGIVPDVVGLVTPTAIPAGADLNSTTYRVPGLYYTTSAAGLQNAPPGATGAATLEVVPINPGTSPGMVVQRWSQGNSVGSSRAGNTTWTSWVTGASQVPASKIRLGMVQIGDNIDVTTAGLISVPVGSQASLGVVKGSESIQIDADGTLTAVGLVAQSEVGAQGGVAGPLDEDPDNPTADQDVSDYTYGRLPQGQLPLGAWFFMADWNASTNSATYTDPESEDVHTINLLAGGTMKDSWEDESPHEITVPANGKVFRVSTAGSTALDGVSSWNVNDLVVAVGDRWMKVGAVTPTNGTFTLAGSGTHSMAPPAGVNPLDCIFSLKVQDTATPANWYDAYAVATVTYSATSISIKNNTAGSLNFRYTLRA